MRILKYLVVVLLIGLASGKQSRPLLKPASTASVVRITSHSVLSGNTTAAWIPNTRADISVTMSPRCCFIRT